MFLPPLYVFWYVVKFHALGNFALNPRQELRLLTNLTHDVIPLTDTVQVWVLSFLNFGYATAEFVSSIDLTIIHLLTYKDSKLQTQN